MILSTNASLSFNTAGNYPAPRTYPVYTPGAGCGYSFDQPIPFVSNAVHRAAIFGPLMDIYPQAGIDNGKMNWKVFGEYPCRTMVVNYSDIRYFSCTTTHFLTTQMVLYETTNVIEVYVGERPSGCSFNSGSAVLGIQNYDGTQAYTPPGRNTGDWSASSEAWRFTPDGAPNWAFAWLHANYNFISADPTMTVCEPGTYIAQATYYSCGGEIVTDEDTVVITRDVDFEVDLGEDISICGNGEEIVLDATPTPPTDATYEWFLDGVSIPGATASTYTVMPPPITDYFIGVYSVDVTMGDCAINDAIEIEFRQQPIIAEEPLDIGICDASPDPNIVDLT